MARKAVQGYTEKSYFDNTRFLGLLATSDPLQEGYFRHLVNLDISDTGQSITPRAGFLTTSLCYITTNQDGSLYHHHIPLSDQTIIYKDERIQEHILYDFSSHKGYIADISTYNLDNKLIPYTRDIGHYDWNDVITFLIKESSSVKDTYTALEAAAYAAETFNYENTYTLIEKSAAEYVSAAIKWDCTYSNLPDPYNMSDVLDIFFDIYPDTYNSCQEIYEAGGIIKLHTSTGVDIYYQVDLISLDYAPIYASLLTAIKQNLTLVDLQLESAYDLNQINKRLIRVNYNNELRFWLQMYYRQDASTIAENTFPANTMVFEALDLHQHPTYDPNERNIANERNLLPETMQNEYTMATRPNGHISILNPFMFTKDMVNNTYHTNYIYPVRDYSFTPHFDLNPAVYELNGTIASDCHWAYRFDITSTARANLLQLDDDVNELPPTVYRSAWFRYNGTSSPTKVFTDYSDTHDFIATDPANRHYNNTHIIVFIVPNMISDTYTTPSAPVGTFPDPALPLEGTSSHTAAGARYVDWITELNNIVSIDSLRTAIRHIGQTALFKVTDLTNDDYYVGTTGGAFNYYDSVSPNLNTIVYSDHITQTDYEALFRTADALIDKLTSMGALDPYGITFKLMPYSVAHTIQWYTGDDYNSTQEVFWFTATSALAGRETDTVLTSLQNWFLYNDVYSFFQNQQVGVLLSALPSMLPRLTTTKFFQNGYNITFYLYPYNDVDLANNTRLDDIQLQLMWDASTPYHISQQWLFGYDVLTVTKVVLELPDDPAKIQAAEGYTTFDNNRLVVWYGSDLYISQAGDLYYFKEASHKRFGEKIIKVIQYKNILLVFTVQHLYAVYEMDMEVATGKFNEDKTPITNTQTVWLSQTVLYNILTSERYADAIKVFNQMVLFYSEDGQLFLIKPSTQIDDQTRFSLQYFNKAANNILQNYEIYMNERLVQYGTEHTLTKEDINIKVDVSINFISIYYDAPGYLTYILHYDVLNNRYFVYDTLSFHNIQQIHYVPGGAFLLTHYNAKSYFTLVYNEPLIADSQSDMSIYNNFQKLPIATLLDTGDMNLNNHLMKRFRDLYITFKNLGSRELMFRIETEIDDVVHIPFYATQLEVKDINGSPYFVTVVSPTEIDLLSFIDDVHSASDEVAAFSHVLRENALSDQAFVLDVANYTSNKLITYRTSILGVGKVFRLKLQFISKGSYKIQQFGIIYKERRV